MARTEDIELVRRVVANEEGAYAEFEKTTGTIVRACLSKVRARYPELAQHDADVLQAFYAMLLENEGRVLRGYRGDSKLTTWIYTVATRFFYRQGRRLTKLREEPLDGPEPRADDESPEVTAQRKQQIEQVRAVLKTLSPEEQALLALLIDEEAPAKAVAQTLGISPAGVRMKKMRLLKKLKKRFEGIDL